MDRCCAGFSLALALVLHALTLQLGVPLSPVLSGQDPVLLQRLTAELR